MFFRFQSYNTQNDYTPTLDMPSAYNYWNQSGNYNTDQNLGYALLENYLCKLITIDKNNVFLDYHPIIHKTFILQLLTCLLNTVNGTNP